jgi:autotransporter translocation and assembly factor TamB
MKLAYHLIIKIVKWLFLTIAGILFFTMTNLGLQTSIGIATKFVPGKIGIRKIEGTWFSKAVISDISYERNKAKLNIQEITISLAHKHLNISKISGIEKVFPQILDHETNLDNVTAMMTYQKLEKKWLANINTHGLWNNKSAKANVTISADSLTDLINLNDITINNAVINVGNNLFTIKHQKDLAYKINLQVYNLKILYRELSGELHAKCLLKNINNIHILEAKLNSKQILYHDFQFHNINLDFLSSLDDPLHPITSHLTIKKIHLFDDKLNNFSLKINGNMLAHSINSHCNFLENEITYHIKGAFKNKIWEAHGDDPNNRINLKFNFKKPEHLDGFIKLSLNDFSQIGELLPKITRVKAKLEADLKFKGTYSQPKILAHAEITEITATIPSMGVKVKPMNIILDIDEKHKLDVNVYGKMRRGVGEFTLTGHMYLNDPNYANSFRLKGKEVEVIKTTKKHLIAQSELNVDGNIEILSGFLHFDDNKTIVKSQDIVFTDKRASKTSKNINIIPHIYLRIENPLPVKGFNLDGDITGKLLITYENHNLYGAGRITIKKGTYALPGKKLTIDHGRIIYPEGTMLSNPLLDIKMIKLKSIDKNVIDAGIFVTGTARNPVISDIGITGGSDQTLSNALMAGSSIIPNELSEILNISDIGIVENNAKTPDFFDEKLYDSNHQDKSFFIGRQFGDRTYLQYQRNLQYETDTVNFKYAITDNLSIGFDAGTQGSGTDLSFSIERD